MHHSFLKDKNFILTKSIIKSASEDTFTWKGSWNDKHNNEYKKSNSTKQSILSYSLIDTYLFFFSE